MYTRGRRGQVIGTDGSIYVGIEKCEYGMVFFKNCPNIKLNLTYNVKFVSNRVTSRTTQNAIKLMNIHRLESFFQSFDTDVRVPGKLQSIGVQISDIFDWKNRQVAENVEQMTAVMNIVNCSAYPSPYVIFGPRKILYF